MITYLKDLTLEEIIRRLKNGEVIYLDLAQRVYIKMIDGIICKIFGAKDLEINHFFSITNPAYYFQTEEPLTFEEGKFYKTREGKKAYISRITETYIYGIIAGKTSLDTWNLKGMHWNNGDKHKNDLISKWED